MRHHISQTTLYTFRFIFRPGALWSRIDTRVQLCFDICSQDGANTHFGTQYGVECFCADDPELESINKYIDEPAECDYECGGDGGEYCGGYNAISVYEIGVSFIHPRRLVYPCAMVLGKLAAAGFVVPVYCPFT